MADIDFEQFMQVLDAALGSSDPNVKKSLRKFLFVAALAMGDDVEPGPFSEMLKSIDKLNARIADLENKQLGNVTLGQDTQQFWDTTSAPIWYNNGTTTAANGTYTIPNTSSTAITLQGGSNTTLGGTSITTGGCTGFTTSASTGSYTINIGDFDLEPDGERMEREIKEKLEGLLS